MKFKAGKLPLKYEDRIAYLYNLQEKFRLYHNQKGKDFRDGKITEKEFQEFQKTWFDDRNDFICTELNKCKKQLKEDTSITSNIIDIEE